MYDPYLNPDFYHFFYSDLAYGSRDLNVYTSV